MPAAPKIFLSASTPDLRRARQAACDALHAMGCQPVIVEHSQADSGSFWHALQPVLRECRAVVHIVGNAYGDEPYRRQAAEHRRSYAQLEYDLAVTLRRPLSIIVCTERFPFDPCPPEDEEKQRLQQTHRTFVQGGGRAFQFVENNAELLVALTALRVPGMPPIVPVLTPLPPPAAPKQAKLRPASGVLPIISPPIPPMTPAVPRRRLFRWVALALVLAILVFVVGVGALAWLVFKRDSTSALPQANARAATPPVIAAAPSVRPSAPVPIVQPAAVATPRPAATPSPVTVVAPPPIPVPAPVASIPSIPVATPMPAPVATPAPRPPAAPPERILANVPQGVQADHRPIDAATRKAIMERVDMAPDIPPERKEKVREIVRRAHEMNRVLVLPFASGQTELTPADVTALHDLVQAPEFKPYREDPTYAFIVLGFADMRGAEDYNMRLSLDRARTVRDLLRKESALPNIIHPVGLGKTTLLDEHNLEKNRIVEVWVVLL